MKATKVFDTPPSYADQLRQVRDYWDEYTANIQVQFTDKRLGTKEYFDDIKVHHDRAYGLANQLIDLPGLKGKSVLEVGCGIGLDALEYARHGAKVTGIDLSPVCISLARRYFSYHDLDGALELANAESLPFQDDAFDMAVARQILMFTPNPDAAVGEIHRVLKPGGSVVALLHNRYSWYALLGRLTGTNLVAQAKDPPINETHSIAQARALFKKFSSVELQLDKLPSETSRRTGSLATLYNSVFVPISKQIPAGIMRRVGWYIIIKAVK